MSGLTIAFICLGKDHPSIVNFQKFGHKYWDDAPKNSSQIGYYFVYYYQQKYVYVHKIINITPCTMRPPDHDWVSTRQTLHLSPRLKEFTWEEWTTTVGLGAPYTPTYRMTQTSSWNQHELKKFDFDFENFVMNCT